MSARLSNYSPPWTEAQIKLLRDNPKVSVRKMAAMVSAIGPARTEKAVASQRKYSGVAPPRKDRGYEQVRRDAGWPKVPLDPAKQDANYLAAFIREAIAAGVMKVAA